ncbi:hypothetical protein [Rhizobium sp. L43]|uniref:hypothetical protein n=1 Tax=Rhizobium sp. L43 TaxID=2035452 RepID=UPI000BEA6912|nr:hypothetical protein [Rhizobium sp. L43]PDS79168.1 hypothetical protein CO667_10145 [Rhizobium sp. L43]
MQDEYTSGDGRGASVSRRDLFQFAAAGIAAALPAAAEASPGDIPQVTLTLEQQAEACIGQLKNILARMHPDFPIVDGIRMLHADGGSTVFVSVKKPPRNVFDGDGLYEVEANGHYYAAGVYWIERVQSKYNKQFTLWGSFIWDGKRIAPREMIAPATILRKLEGGAT